MNAAGPWEAEDAFPLKPEGPDCGYFAGRKAFACSPEELIHETARPNSRIMLVWTPESPRYVTAWEVPFLAGALRHRTVLSLRQRAKVTAFVLLLLGWLAWTKWKTREFPIYAAVAVFMGLLPLILALKNIREVSRGSFNPASSARLVRFMIWLRRRPQSSGWVLAGILACAGAWQVIVGLYRSISFAGHAKSLVTQGEPWRLLTAGLVHAGPLHFGLNVLALVTLAKLAEPLTSRFHVFTVFLVSILTGSVASQFLNPSVFSVGASGGILGILGFIAVLAMRSPRLLPPEIMKWILMMILGVVVMGALAPGLIDNAGHAGGFIGGAILGWMLVPRSRAIPARADRGIRGLGWLSILIVAAACLALPLTTKSDRVFKDQVYIAVFTAKKDPELALRYANTAIHLKPKHPWGYHARGDIRYILGDYKAAVEDLTTALKLDPNLVAAYVTRSAARSMLGDFKGALADSEIALKREPDKRSAAEARLMALESAGDYEGALKGLDQEIADRTQDPDLRRRRAWLLVLLGRFDEALKESEAALLMKPDDACAFNTRGLAKAGKGDYDGAIQDYSEALRSDPDHPYAQSNRGFAKLAKGDSKGALEDFELALKEDSEDPDALYGRGEMRRLAGDPAGARADFKEALRAAEPGWHRRARVEAALKELP